MRLLLRCDAGGRTGIGHAVRSVAMAETAQARGHEVHWSGRLDGLGWLADDMVWGSVLPPADDPADLAALALRVGADAVHVDHYGLPRTLRDEITSAGLVMSNVEDFTHGRRPADVSVDPNLGADRQERPDDGTPVVLRGLDHALLRAVVREARAVRAAHDGVSTRPSVLVVMGGTDPAGLLDPIVAALVATRIDSDVEVVVPTGRGPLLAAASGPVRIRSVAPRANLPLQMARADLVLSAAGTTVWELCCIGTPMALVRAAANQAEGYAAVVSAGAATGLGGADDVRDVTATAGLLRPLLTDPNARAALGSPAGTLVDGLGTARVLAEIENAVARRSTLRAREADAGDADLLLHWRNDATTRLWSRSSGLVCATDHRDWLERSLHRQDRLLLVVEATDGDPVGTVRWDLAGDGYWEVSVTVAPRHRGRRLAGLILRSGEEALRARCGPGTPARAYIHRDNAASRRLFDRAGYVADGVADDAGFDRYRKVLD